MSSIKCPNCNLTNFANAQFCKRCNLALDQFPANRLNHDTQILNSAGHTHIRQPLPPRQNEPPVQYQNNPPHQYQQRPAPPNYGQNYQGYQNNPPPFQGQPNYGQNYQGQPFQPQSAPPPIYEYTLPKFPKGQRPPEYNAYQNNFYQKGPYQPIGEPAFRRFGSEIALHKNSTLPECCVACGKTIFSYHDGSYISQKFRWHHPAVYVALISPLIYVILAACLSESFSINVPMCREHIKTRESLKTTMIVGGLLSFGFIIFCFSMGFFGYAAVLLAAVSLALILICEYGYKPLRVKSVDGAYYHLTGASSEFLDTIPY